MTFFVKHPPGDGLPPLDREKRDLYTTGETPKHQAAIRAIERCEARFLDTSNPIEAINAFMYANGAGLYPPSWVLEFLNERFLKASKGGGLDQAFGFTARGQRGRTAPAEQQRLDRRNYVWCRDFFKLEAVGLKRSAAGRAIAALWQERTGEAFSGTAVVAAVTATEWRYALERVHTLAAGNAWTMEEKRALLRVFGAVNLPRNIRKLYGL